MNKNSEKILITTKVGAKEIVVEDVNDKKNRIVLPFRGMLSNKSSSTIVRMKGRNKDNLLIQVFNKLVKDGMSKKEKQKLMDNIYENVDPQIVYVLNQYDSLNKNGEKKSTEYAKIMTMDIDRQRYEKKRDYKKRVDLVKMVELENAGISLKYDLSNINFIGKGFVDKLRAIGDALRNRKFSKIKLLGEPEAEEIKQSTQLQNAVVSEEASIQKEQKESKEQKDQKTLIEEQSPKEPQSNIINLNQERKKLRLTAAKGLRDRLKQKVGDLNFQKKIRKRLAGIGTTTLLTLGSVAVLTPLAKEVNKTIETVTAPKTTYSNSTIVQEEENDDLAMGGKRLEQVDIKETIKDAIDLKFGKDTRFNLSEGTYWESPDGTGAHGEIKPEEGSLFVTDVDVLDEKGFKHYGSSDGLSINEIKENHPNAKFSYHINRMYGDKEWICGWVTDEATMEKIDDQMTISRLKTLTNYISPEVKKIFNNILNSDSGKTTEVNKQVIEKIISEAQIAEKEQGQESTKVLKDGTTTINETSKDETENSENER